MTAVQGRAAWDEQTMHEVVSRQSKQVGLLMHLVHWRPAFPLTHTSHSFWQKLHASLTYSPLITLDELHLVWRLSGQLTLSQNRLNVFLVRKHWLDSMSLS